MAHPSKEKLEKYAARTISAAEMTRLMLHLENCGKCSGTIERVTFSAANDGFALFDEAKAKAFHLDYEEHLQPFVDNEADAATREIVQSHTRVCSNCAFQLRELREFAESLRLREIVNNTRAEVSIFKRAALFLSNLSQNIALQMSAAGVLIVLLSAAFWLTIGSKESENKPEILDVVSNSSNSNSLSVSIFPTPASESPVPGPTTETLRKTDQDKTPGRVPRNPLSEQARTISKLTPPKSVKKAVDGFHAIAEEFRENIKLARTSGHIKIPARLEKLANVDKLRGDSKKVAAILSPDREILRETKPNFSWTADGLQNNFYLIEIYDENNNPVARSNPVKTNHWTPEKNLERGKIYQWELRILESLDLPEKTIAIGKFSILDREAQIKLKEIKRLPALDRGIILASYGLIKDARREFRKALNSNSGKKSARKFLKQLGKYK